MYGALYSVYETTSRAEKDGFFLRRQCVVDSFGSSALISATFNFIKIFALNYLDKVILRKHSIDPGTESTLTHLEIRGSTETAASHRTASHDFTVAF